MHYCHHLHVAITGITIIALMIRHELNLGSWVQSGGEGTERGEREREHKVTPWEERERNKERQRCREAES